MERWQEMATEELEALNEIDWEKEAELTADPDYKPPPERPGMLQTGWEKINDWILEKSVQLVDLAKRAGRAALKPLAWLIKKVQGFCGNHPTVCKIAIMTLTVIAFYIVIALLFEQEAQAKLYRDGKPVPDAIVDGYKGQLSDIIDIRNKRGDTDTPRLYQVLAQIDELHDSKTPHEIMKSKEKIDGTLRWLHDGLKDAWNVEGSFEGLKPEEGKELVDRWIDIGERTSAWYREITLKGEGYLSQTLDYGKTLAKKGAEAGEEVLDVYKKTRRQGN